MNAGANTGHDKGPLLGQAVSGSSVYDPSLLFPVPRQNARSELPGGGFQGHGEDLWQCYELGWLDASGRPCMAYGQLIVPATSANLVESKSLKLYLNSLNNHRFASDAEAVRTIEDDVSAVVGERVELLLAAVDDAVLGGTSAPGRCLDDLTVTPDAVPARSRLTATGQGELQCYTHAVRSLCPVTAQPDWATVLVHLRGALPAENALAAYLWSFRDHQEFHEQCVERIYTDLQLALRPEYLSVYALYTRRGGIAISPWRCSQPDPAPRIRLHRQ